MAQWPLFSPTKARDAAGLQAEHFVSADFSGEPFKTARRAPPGQGVSTMTDAPRQPLGSIRWTGWFWPAKDGPARTFRARDGDVDRFVGKARRCHPRYARAR